jgi:hypothetical protein
MLVLAAMLLQALTVCPRRRRRRAQSESIRRLWQLVLCTQKGTVNNEYRPPEVG